ncbi:MAG: type II secretion system protein GspL [Gammaproteobacteria bacterium]|nr:type II secretion system protein GspL [Gammaproteobacteria bacterium]MDH4253882.1 type II secretion system protein GspL [Gammaproteobacteria bacterium]MDH5309805.1 type II secretion system protein GspL [Gammaproteobacteria bacterium]
MAEFLVIRIGEGESAPAAWIAVDSSGTRLGPPSSGDLAAATPAAADRKVIVLVPATEVLTTTIDLPIKSAARIQSALPFALEEFLADDVEDLHFAAGARRETGRLPVSVINRQKLRDWLDQWRALGLRPSAVMADCYGLARLPGTISMLVTADQVYVNDGADTELVLQGVGPQEALAAIGVIDDGDEPGGAERGRPRHVLAYCDAEAEQKYAREWLAVRHDFEDLDIKLLPDGALPRLAVTVASGAGVNLLQGEFGAKTEYAALLRPWRHAAMLLLALAVTLVAGRSLEFLELRNRAGELEASFLAEYREIAPTVESVPDPAAVVASLRARAGGGQAPAVFLQSLEHLSRAMQQNREATIEAISYRAGVVDVRLTAPSVSVLDNITRVIGESGAFQARIQSTDQEGEKVNSRLQIQAGGA